MKILKRTLWALAYILPAVLFFSYYPVIGLGANSSMNFELSLPLIWLVLFDASAFFWLIITYFSNHRKHASSSASEPALSFWGKNFPGISDRRFFLFTLFPLYLTISIFWSANPLRGLLTAGVMWLVFFAVFTILCILPLLEPRRPWRRYLLAIFLISSAAICLFCFVQSILDLIGWSRENTLLCAGCTYRSFGFPHPSGFAIEPQFMGNLLLAPTLTALYLLVMKKGNIPKENKQSLEPAPQSKHTDSSSREKAATIEGVPSEDKHTRSTLKALQLVAITMLFSTTLFFTFSRGAIYAYAVALVIMIAIFLKRRQFRWSLITIPVFSFLLSLVLQGTFSALSPTPETFSSGIAKSIHQLSLGIVDLRAPAAQAPVQNPVPTVENSEQTVDKTSQNVEKSPATSGKPVENQVSFDGYVAESTDIRLSLNRTAVKTWLDSPTHPRLSFGSDCDQLSSEPCHSFTPTSILFGVGLGGAGTAMHAAYPDLVTSPKEIVQNQFFSLLLETGLIGILLAVFSLLLAFAPHLFSTKFLDGRAASSARPTVTASQLPRPVSPFWRHPALPLLLPLLVTYLITLSFFSGLPNALQIYLMPPLLYYLFLPNLPRKSLATSPSPHKNPSRPHGSKNHSSKN